MTSDPAAALGLDAVLRRMEMDYEYDADGRIVAVRGGGETPRFVLGRSVEGCVWRFARGLDEACVIRVARLAAREPGFPFDGAGSARPAEPERWVMIERVLGIDRAEHPSRRRAVLSPDGVEVGELWIAR
ncbi:MAG: hypothetical protein H6748_05125 [Spirochaetaceae bacterium]|nr:hypothetical protein [Myxococcales bacterium]MCB9723413.1 hypothetical protein [Spirochaetaceae bacterium]HPG24493.1 hypothetical protein [Myxococcota bacterium]